MKVKLLGIGTTVFFSLYLAFLGSFGIQKTEAVSSIIEHESELSESEIDLNDFGITQRQFASGQSYDEVRELVESFTGSFSNCFCLPNNRWIRLDLFFSFKLSFKDLTVLYHNFRI